MNNELTKLKASSNNLLSEDFNNNLSLSCSAIVQIKENEAIKNPDKLYYDSKWMSQEIFTIITKIYLIKIFI